MPKNAQHVSMSFSYFLIAKQNREFIFLKQNLNYMSPYTFSLNSFSPNILTVQLPNAAIYIIIIIDTIEFNL